MKLSMFQSSLETTRAWIRDLMDVLDTSDENFAYRAFRTVVHELRDHLTVDEAVHLAAQFPLILKGAFFDGWRPTGKPVRDRSRGHFLEKIANGLREFESVEDVEAVVVSIFELLETRISEGEINDVITSLPRDIRELWPSQLKQLVSRSAGR